MLCGVIEQPTPYSDDNQWLLFSELSAFFSVLRNIRRINSIWDHEYEITSKSNADEASRRDGSFHTIK